MNKTFLNERKTDNRLTSIIGLCKRVFSRYKEGQYVIRIMKFFSYLCD
jgi:hypothetical protein